MEVAKAPDRVLMKFINPAAEFISSPSTLERATAVEGMKKNGIPKPNNIRGKVTCMCVMSVLAIVR